MNAKTLRQLGAPPTVKGFAAAHSIVTSAGATELSEDGKAILRREIEEFDALPDARDAASHIAQIIEAEQREEINIDPKTVKVHDDCTIELAETTHGLSDIGFSMLARAIGPSGSTSYLRNVDVDLRAHNMRTLLSRHDEPIKLRTRNTATGDGREIFSIVTSTYPTVYASDVLRRVATRAATDAKGLWTYNPNTTKVCFRELMRQEINPDTYRHSADDVFQIGREWSLRDDGASSVRMALLTFRQACANMLMLQSDAFIRRVRHRGNRESMMGRVDNLFSRTSEFTRLFSESWNAARITKWCSDEHPSLDVAVSAYALLLNKQHLPSSKDADMLAADLGVAWLAEPGNTVADIVNGATRYARTLSVTNSDCFRSQKLEAAAGALLTLPAKTWEATRRL